MTVRAGWLGERAQREGSARGPEQVVGGLVESFDLIDLIDLIEVGGDDDSGLAADGAVGRAVGAGGGLVGLAHDKVATGVARASACHLYSFLLERFLSNYTVKALVERARYRLAV